MIGSRKVLAVIPARGGSKGVPRKNIRELAGKPLIAWTIEEAQKSKYIDRLVLSSDDDEIISVADSYGCEVPFVRPAEMAQDETPGIDPILHALQEIPGYDIVVVLQPTSPLRIVQDIDEGLEFFKKLKASVCVSVSEVTKSPYWMFTLDNQSRLEQLLQRDGLISRRQDLPVAYMPNGALFAADTRYIQDQQSFYTNETIGFTMPRERSYDIDDEIDFIVCEALLEKRLTLLN